ncbi:MAG: glycerol-3-phosphate dehydrogenase/oxidase [Chloroflexota bacterium]|nr:glycerol-3-phosphate dehydrogenase/oxidase [Chloroflexota bacterium]
MSAEGVDILVVGGGITGAGVALDASTRGFKVGLVEKADFGSGTSSKSTKLVHGGIRYLPQFDFVLVREALVERGLLTRNAPFLVQPIGFVLPLYKGAKKPLGTPISPPRGIGMSYVLQAGLLMYDLLSGRLGVGRHKRLGASRARKMVPCLKDEGLIDAFVYYDAQTDDTRLTSTVLRTAAQAGAWLANYAEVTGFTQQGGRITGAQVRDTLSGEMLDIKAGTVVNAGGVFAGRIESMAGDDSQVHIEPAKGIHLTVSRSALKIGKSAVVLPETEDGRILFIVPWGPRVTIGTTDTPGGDIDHPVADKVDVAYLLRHVNRYMKCQLTEADIISTWAGYRPLVSSKKPGVASSKLSRSHVVLDGPGGMVTIVGGKLTTYRRMAEDTMEHIARQIGGRSEHKKGPLPLAGSDGWKEAAAQVQARAAGYGLRDDTVRRLGNYGSSALTLLSLIDEDRALARRVVADLPYIMAEVVFACRHEMAMQLDDVLVRRLHINFEDWERGLRVAGDVAALMARELGWDAGHESYQVSRYRELVLLDDPTRIGKSGGGSGDQASSESEVMQGSSKGGG